jgi:hypothetical protein
VKFMPMTSQGFGIQRSPCQPEGSGRRWSLILPDWVTIHLPTTMLQSSYGSVQLASHKTVEAICPRPDLRYRVHTSFTPHSKTVLHSQHQQVHCQCRLAGRRRKREKKKHTTPGIRWSSPTQLLVWRSLTYLRQSGRDAELSSTYGRM